LPTLKLGNYFQGSQRKYEHLRSVITFFVQHALKYLRILEKQLRSIIFDTSCRTRYRIYCAYV